MKYSTVLLFCFIAAFEVSQSASQKYGSSCSAEKRCDSRSGTISCSLENLCRCADPETMVYDHHQNICLSKIGTMCYTRSLKNQHVRNCVAGAKCMPVSSQSVFGTCQDASEEEEVNENVQEEEVMEEIMETTDEPADPTSPSTETATQGATSVSLTFTLLAIVSAALVANKL